MKILVADALEDVAIDGLRALGADLHLVPDASGDALAKAVGETRPEVLVVRSTKAPAEVMDAAGGSLKLIIRAGAGTDNIDKPAATERRVAVCNCPGMNAVAVAELTIGHLIALDRRLPEQDAALKAGHWNKAEFSKARGLKGRSLLVVGTGAIGLEVIKRARAFDMTVTAQSRSLTQSMAEAIGVSWIPFTREALLEVVPNFDAVSMHVPVTDETRGMCNADFFARMKPGAFFINTSRGAIMDEAALAVAVSERGIRAALDVYNDQPAGKSAEWRPDVATLDGVHCSHHVGASTDQAQLAVAEEVVRIVRVYAESGRFEHQVNARG
ncbi:MAG: hypothetical protein CMJ31_05985 [Phycisphaerae bacterium]|nr:hypothetical protein [Phycisphaerae bacterium]